MNYFIDGVFKDKQFWGRLFTIIIIIVAILDLRHGFFGGKLFYFVAITGSLIIIALIFWTIFREKKEKNDLHEQQNFERKRRIEMRDIIRDNAGFKTMCFQCVHFDNEKMSCIVSYDLKNKKALKTKFKDSKFEYCLYWEVRSNMG